MRTPFSIFLGVPPFLCVEILNPIAPSKPEVAFSLIFNFHLLREAIKQ